MLFAIPGFLFIQLSSRVSALSDSNIGKVASFRRIDTMTAATRVLLYVSYAEECVMTARLSSRRRFVKGAFVGGAAAGIGDFGFLSHLRPLSAAETKLPAGSVQFRPEIEPLVRVLEDTPRDRLLEEVAAHIRRGLSYREVLSALCWPACAMCSRGRWALSFTRCWS